MSEKNSFMKIVGKEPVDIEFSNISFAVGKTEILHSVSGKFSPGQLVAILGASGAGKTTLLNILTGQFSRFSGKVLINNADRDMRKFRKISAYVMQEDLLQPYLTVEESMSIVSQLKLDRNYSREEKITAVHDVLSAMGLDKCLNTRVERLSGGERKRLALALELINNPPFIFLDEPTTGLDNVSMKNCVKILKSLANQGRTIICTIHQPSDSVFKLFDIVYFLSEGSCVYNGSVAGIVPFLSKLGYNCPLTYSPADYILEILHSNPTSTDVLSKTMQNGKIILATNKCKIAQEKIHNGDDIDTTNEFAVSVFRQFTILLYRNFIQQKRKTTVLFLQLLHHSLCGFLFGVLFYNVGNSGSESFANLKFYFATTIILIITHLLGPILLFPDEVKLLHREYSNRWYSLKAYFAALSLSLVPTMVLTSLLYVITSYVMTGQPMELERFIWFLVVNILMSLTADGLGVAVGSVLNPLNGAVVGSLLTAVLIVLSMHNMGYADKSSYLTRILSNLNFQYDAFVALSTAMLNDREPLVCEDIFCYFGDLKFLMKKMGLEGRNQYVATLILFLFFVVFKIISYACLRFRLSQQYRLTAIKLMKLFKLQK